MTTKFMMRNVLTIGLLVGSRFLTFSQAPAADDSDDGKHKISVMLGVSALKYFGYVGTHSNLSPILDTRLGYFLSVEQRFGKIFGVELTGIYGQLAGTDNAVGQHLNFQSQIMQGHLMLTANFDKVLKEDPAVSPFLNVGIGYMMYSTYSDLKDGNGKSYNYWPDGSIRTQPDSLQYQSTATVTKRDYKYETKMNTNGQTGCLVMPFGGGLNFHFSDRLTTSIGVNYTMCFTNWIDNTGLKPNSYLSANVGIQYEFKKSKKEKEEEGYKGVNFANADHMDADKDGVPDDRDDCLGTPEGVKVDRRGCPLDSDHDGVADYLDKEPNTPKGTKVDGTGKKINEEEEAKHQLAWDSEAPERSREFNVAPSKEYLEKVERDAQKVRAKSNKVSRIPADLQSADIDKNGFISANEITKTIDSFFEGTGDFTVEKINKLIDYFFEQ